MTPSRRCTGSACKWIIGNHRVVGMKSYRFCNLLHNMMAFAEFT
jgi:hypothetical protein